jgi:putative transposase
MPRGNRVCPGGTVSHVLNRGNGGQRLFNSPADYLAFVQVVRETLLVHALRILAYCIMPNHWHFVVWPEKDDQASLFMHQLTTTHVRRWHRFRESDGRGHVYQGPFKSFPVQSDGHFYTLCRYVERNAVRAGLVSRAEDWIWGSAWARDRSNDVRAIPLSQWPLSYPAAWLDYVNQPLTAGELRDLRNCVERGRPYGTDQWVRDTAISLGLEYTLRTRGRPRIADV